MNDMVFYEKKGRYIIDFTDIPTSRAVMPELPAENRKGNFQEVETGFAEDVAMAEAKRCLSCRRCLGCALCWAECKPEAIDFSMKDKDVSLQHLDKIILSSGLHRDIKPITGTISDKHMNVVTDLQAERMLSTKGPSSGFIIRPQDGEIPNSIAIVQTFQPEKKPVRDAVLTLAINEAIIAKKKIDDLNVSIISPSMDTFRQDTEDFPKNLSGITCIDGTVLEAMEAGKVKNIQLKYAIEGDEQVETFDLIVILTEPQLSPGTIRIAKQLGIPVEATDFMGSFGKTHKTDCEDVLLVTGL
jgi:heterodisulfide reductase subunit A-like polyferredoxin